MQGVPWVVDLVRLALAPGLPPGVDLPVVLFYDELEHLNSTVWLGFERILYIQDRSAGAGQLGGWVGRAAVGCQPPAWVTREGRRRRAMRQCWGSPGCLGRAAAVSAT